MQISQLNQSGFIYQPRSAGAQSATPLTAGVWQNQQQKLAHLLAHGPEPSKAAPVERVAGRQGEVLGEDNFLKADQYPGLHSDRLQDRRTRYPQPKIEGAPNYRELGEGIHGTAQPTIDGMRGVLEQAGAGPEGEKTAVWTNMREEPVVYINGQPHNLRHVKAPFYNQASPGRSASEVEALEAQLKQDVLAEAARNGGKLKLHDEEAGPPPRVVEREVEIESVQTVSEVYAQLKSEGYRVDYQRIPVTDMKKPEDQDIDALVAGLKKTDPDAALIFNCHAGQGRTTTAMVLASLMRNPEEQMLKTPTVREDIREQGKYDPSKYRELLGSVRDAEKLVHDQSKVDQVVEKYGDVHDLKKSVGKERAVADAAATPEERRAAQGRASDNLQRYHTLVAFEAYSQAQAPDFKMSFSEWKAANPHIEENLSRVQLALRTGRTEFKTELA